MKNQALFIYRGAAIIAGIGWIVSILANLVNGTVVFEFLQFISTEEFDYHPMLDYWMKMAGLAFGFIGVGFLHVGIKWEKALPYGIYFASYQILSFVSVLITMVRLDLDSSIYLMDCVFFLGTGLPMLWAWNKIRS